MVTEEAVIHKKEKVIKVSVGEWMKGCSRSEGLIDSATPIINRCIKHTAMQSLLGKHILLQWDLFFVLARRTQSQVHTIMIYLLQNSMKFTPLLI